MDKYRKAAYIMEITSIKELQAEFNLTFAEAAQLHSARKLSAIKEDLGLLSGARKEAMEKDEYLRRIELDAFEKTTEDSFNDNDENTETEGTVMMKSFIKMAKKDIHRAICSAISYGFYLASKN